MAGLQWGWRVHGTGRTVTPGEVVAPDERLTWPRTVGIGLQHIIAMFGATVTVPLITGFSVQTTLFFSAIGTIGFLLITGNRLPSYLGSSFAFLTPIAAAKASGVSPEEGLQIAVGGILATGILLALVGVIAHLAGTRWIEVLMPPVVTGTIVMIIGFNLAGAAWGSCDAEGTSCTGFRSSPITASITTLAIVLIAVLFKGIVGRLAILLGVLVGYVVALIRSEVDFAGVTAADWVGFPTFVGPKLSLSVVGLFLPVVLVLIAENIGHVKSVAAITGRNFDDVTGRALLADGVATTIAGLGGGSGTTTYAENIGVMAATRVYSTAAYWVAGLGAFVLSLWPKFGAAVQTIPQGVLGGATTILFGMIGLLGARIWIQSKVDFSRPENLMPAAIGLIVGIANFTWARGDLQFGGIAIGTVAAIGLYHLMRWLGRVRGTSLEPASPASAPAGDEPAVLHDEPAPRI